LDGLNSRRVFNDFLGASRTFSAYAQKQDCLSEPADLLARLEKRKTEVFASRSSRQLKLAAFLDDASPSLALCFEFGRSLA
jgi:hypothetical protein